MSTLFPTGSVQAIRFGVLSIVSLCLLSVMAQANIEITRTCKDANYWPEKAVPACSELLQDPQLSDDVKEEVYLLRGRANINLEDWPEALVDIAAVLALNPDSLKAWRMKVIALDGMEDYPAALEAAEKVISLDPESQFGHPKRYRLLLSLGREDEEEVRLRESLASEPNSIRIRGELGVRLLLQNRYTEAAEMLAPVVRIDPNLRRYSGAFIGACYSAGDDCPVLFPGKRSVRPPESCETALNTLVQVLSEAKRDNASNGTASYIDLLPNLETAKKNAQELYMLASMHFEPPFSELSAKRVILADRLLGCYEEGLDSVSEDERQRYREFQKIFPPQLREAYLDLAHNQLDED